VVKQIAGDVAFDPQIVARLRAAGCVFAEDEARLLVEAAATLAELATLIDRRVAGEPLEHILGWVQFCGLRVAVDPAVFVPRRRTEFLVRRTLDVFAPGEVLVDLCCGCGAVGAAVRAALPGVEVHAVDVDPAAVRCARRNLVGGHVYEGDLYVPLPEALRGRVAAVTANAPYVPTEAVVTMPPEARLFEPPTALDGGPDGLDVLRRVIDGAPNWLAPGGHLLVESSRGQAPLVAQAMSSAGLAPRVTTCDDAMATVVMGRLTRSIRRRA
jgi:release factor glutamine methyltransferase